ncbi:uncharacterized protein LOC123709093 [Pieris brassicae]|uniref:uncharacterized protein LOC123709093 n=1 Tax=Pieris brassicae TaxID=7116 RepID=UPI001E65E6E9|nr:uncharacterized protein LOC123709093 [Pieris brassicae]
MPVTDFNLQSDKMKFLVFGLALLVAGASAFPEAQVSELQGRDFAGNVRSIIELLRQLIMDNNFDPFILERREREVVLLPYVNLQYLVEELEITGASNIVINKLDYSNIFSRFRYDLELPELAFSLGNAKINGLLLSRNLNSELAGSLKISGVRLAGEAYVTIDILAGGTINIDSLEARFDLAGLEAEIEVTVQENDLSERVNVFINERIPAWIKDNENDINRVLATVIRTVAQYLLNR